MKTFMQNTLSSRLPVSVEYRDRNIRRQVSNKSSTRPVNIRALAEDAKGKLIKLASGTDRGISTSVELSKQLMECVRELEDSKFSNTDTTINSSNYSLDGKWDLVWSTTAPERASSPMFWAVTGFVDTLVQPGLAKQVFQFTDTLLKPTVGLKYGNIRQTINTQSQVLKSEVELTVSPGGFGAPAEISGNVISEAKITPTGDSDVLDVSMVSTRVEDSPLPFVSSVTFPTEALFDGLLTAHNTVLQQNVQAPQVVPLNTTYLDETMRVARVDDNVFVYTRSMD